MEHENDPKLRELLKEWEVPGAPAQVDARVLAIPERGWRFWLRGSIRIPVPVGLAALVLLVVLAGLALRKQTEPQVATPAFNLADFQPAETVQVRIEGGENAR